MGGENVLPISGYKESKNETSCYVINFILVITIVGLGLVLLGTTTLTSRTPSIACDYPSPLINLTAMHREIRINVLTDNFSGEKGAILMHGGFVTYRYNTDVEEDFRQESNFWYLTGFDQPNGTLLLDIATQITYFFIPFQPLDYAIWNGKIETTDSIKSQYGFDEVYYQEDLAFILGMISNYDPTYIIFVMDSFVEFPNKDTFTINIDLLPQALDRNRALKTNSELQLMRYAANVSSEAHRWVMKEVSPGHYEYNAEGTFLDGCFACGLTFQAYLPICASGNNSAVLHYNDNHRLMQNGDILLIDAGAEYFGYAADITRTYPVNGTYTESQKQLYNMVLNVQQRVFDIIEVGLTWSELQRNTCYYVCEELMANGFVNTASVDACYNYRLYYYFFPHGVSHMLGLDVHDPRSYIYATSLQARNVITVEPGIYFNQALLEEGFKDPSISPFLDEENIRYFLDQQIGGVRIEDIVIIHDTYIEIISNGSPRTVEGIESLMNSNKSFFSKLFS